MPDGSGGTDASGNSIRAMTPEEMAAGGGGLPGPVADMGHGGNPAKDAQGAVSTDTPQGTKGFGQAGGGVSGKGAGISDSAMGAPVYLRAMLQRSANFWRASWPRVTG